MPDIKSKANSLAAATTHTKRHSTLSSFRTGPKRVVEFTFHSAHHLPIGDLHNLSCDLYINVDLSIPNYRGDENGSGLKFRTPTVRKTREPVWTKTPPTSESALKPKHSAGEPISPEDKENEEIVEDPNDVNKHLPSVCQWVVGGISSNKIQLIMHLMDEDSNLHDDSLGIAKLIVDLDEGKGEEKEVVVKKRRSSAKVYLQTYMAALNPAKKLNKHAYVVVSWRVIGKDENDSERPYTLGPNKWSQHFSPLIGFVTPASHAKRENPASDPSDSPSSSQLSLHLSSSTFVANKLQLTGPTPPHLSNHFFGFSNNIIALFNSKGLKGLILNRAAHKQYRTLYSYDRATKYGVVGVGFGGKGIAEEDPGEDGEGLPSKKGEEGMSDALAKQFLRMTSYGEGGRVFTYVITLDGEWRWTETGEEFAVDFISKHTMHADVNQTILWSGEFFIRRVVDEEGGGFATGIKVERGTISEADKDGVKEDDPILKDKAQNEGEDSKGNDHAEPAGKGDIPQDPKLYELVIDNDSGTYRPSLTDLPTLHSWLSHPSRLGGLGRVTAVHCFDDGLVKVKKHRSEIRKLGKGLIGPRASGAAQGEVGKVKKSVLKVEKKVATIVGKDASKIGDPTGAGRQVMAKRKGSDSSVSSIGSGVLGRGRRGSVESDEVKRVLDEAKSREGEIV
ncbi:hypothetical protein DL96DRAFT_1627944 [Flagelloscypha sp. PMI_526]|nr:hypothetical protein DL96DRAFT_1627944 [Flagelloscypha sp. PMI_526]